MAPGQTVSSYVIIDTLPNGVVINGPITSSGAGGATITTMPRARAAPPSSPPPSPTRWSAASTTRPSTSRSTSTRPAPAAAPSWARSNGSLPPGKQQRQLHRHLDADRPARPHHRDHRRFSPTLNDITAKSIAEQKSVAVVEGGFAIARQASGIHPRGAGLELLQRRQSPADRHAGRRAAFRHRLHAHHHLHRRRRQLLGQPCWPANTPSPATCMTGISTIIVDTAAAGIRLGIGADARRQPRRHPQPSHRHGGVPLGHRPDLRGDRRSATRWSIRATP